MNSCSAIRTIRAFALLLILSLTVLAVAGCGDDSVSPKKPTVNKVLQLDGTGDFLSIPIANHTFATFTIEAKVKVPVYTTNLHYVSLYQNAYLVLGDWDNPGQISTWVAGLDPVNAGDVGAEASITADAWHHFAFSFDGTTQYVLIDGVVVLTAPTTGAVTNNPSSFNSGLKIGCRYSGTTQFVTGQMDEIRVWNIYRTETQIREKMNSRITAQTGLVGYWNFDDGTASDLSGNDADGTLQGNATIVNK